MKGGHALVVGASFAGFSAARVLADVFDRVTVVERDRLPEGPEDRAGVPQGKHVHALLARGLIELERLFPGFRARALELGAVETDMGLDAAFLRTFGWAPRQRFGVRLLLASRRVFESVVRERFRALPNVRIIERAAVTGLVGADEEGRLRISGVSTSATDEESTLRADLIVDASGRTSKAGEWLRSLGVEPPAETVVDAHWGYSTRWFQAPERLPQSWWWRTIVIEPRPPESMFGCVLIPIENRQWMVTLGGCAGHYPSVDEQDFVAGLERLRSPLIAEAVRLARPISPVYGNRTMANRLRHFESWNAPVAGFLAVGDSVCAFNPIYGQGMTTAALCARVLEETIRQTGATSAELPRVFFQAQAGAQSDAWSLATGADLSLPGTEGKRPPGSNLVGRYVRALFAATADDPVVHQRLFEVLQMLRPVSAFFAPPIAARVARSALRSLVRGGASSASAVPAFPAGVLPS